MRVIINCETSSCSIKLVYDLNVLKQVTQLWLIKNERGIPYILNIIRTMVVWLTVSLPMPFICYQIRSTFKCLKVKKVYSQNNNLD